ncbi:MAG: lysylphosphatidylglycerol synthase transmembrane domain-containing protein [Streptosporangiaceae bacterium]
MPDSSTVPGVLASAAMAAPSGPGGRMATVRTRLGRIASGRPVRWGFAAVAVALGGYAIAREWPDVRAALASIGPVAAVAAFVSVLAAMFAAMQVWRVLLAAVGSPVPVRVGARIMFVGQLGKYLPGSVWPVLAQMELGRAYRVPRHHSASAALLAMVVSLLSGLLTALLTLPFVAGSAPYFWAFLAVPALLACLYPRILNALLGRVFRLIRRPPLEQRLTARVIATSLAWSFGSWICYGLQIWLLATRLGAPHGKAALLGLGGFAFAWCVGFLVVLAPAGAGVREVLLVALLSPVLGTGAGTAVALLSRALTTAGDLLAAAGAAGFSRPSRAYPDPAEPGQDTEQEG